MEQGWKGLNNGELLRRAASESLDAFLTADQNLVYQQNLAKLGIGLGAVAARKNRLAGLLPLVPAILLALPAVRKGEVVGVTA